MSMCIRYAAWMAVWLALAAGPAHAQLFEEVGTRAQGMGGAFVAVADDATATWWNPAGMVNGGLFSAVAEKGRVTRPENPSTSFPGRRGSEGSIALGVPSLGMSYYRLRISEIRPIVTNDGVAEDRQDDGGVGGRIRSLAFAQFGATVGQSLGDHVVVATTLKLLRGGVGSGFVDGTSDVLDAADDLDFSRQIRADLDLGAMLSFPAFRAGLTIRNLTQPTFGEGIDEFEVERQVRAGVALLTPRTNESGSVIVAVDGDLTRTTTVFGEVRHLAAGGEAWLIRRRLGLRAGVSVNTIGERRPATSTGASVAVTRSIYIEGGRTFGTDDSIRGWTSAVRFAF